MSALAADRPTQIDRHSFAIHGFSRVPRNPPFWLGRRACCLSLRRPDTTKIAVERARARLTDFLRIGALERSKSPHLRGRNSIKCSDSKRSRPGRNAVSFEEINSKKSLDTALSMIALPRCGQAVDNHQQATEFVAEKVAPRFWRRHFRDVFFLRRDDTHAGKTPAAIKSRRGEVLPSHCSANKKPGGEPPGW